MGSYLNPGAEGFKRSLNSLIYVDKTGLIAKTNCLIGTQQAYVCVSRPRRFGKTMALDMLAAYYGFNLKTDRLFRSLKIAGTKDYDSHLNQYYVIRVNMQEFLSLAGDAYSMLNLLQGYLRTEFLQAFPDVVFLDKHNLIQIMKDVFSFSQRPFVILIDEWDCLFREFPNDFEAQKRYLDFLRVWLKDQPYIALAYMTGILPIKKYGTHSALNMFTEYSMTNPGEFAQFFGFTEEEVQDLCSVFKMDFEEVSAWYDGYGLFCRSSEEPFSIYNPKSVVESMLHHELGTYWNQTETYEALKVYIDMDIEGLREDVIKMLAGNAVPVNIRTFSNDMVTFTSKNDVLTLLIHLGYLFYHKKGTASIPNKEVAIEFTNVIKTGGWGEVARSISLSKGLLNSIWATDTETVAAGIERSHNEISALKYNDENSLSCVISLAFYYAREYYTVIREFPSGKGFADIVYLPRPNHQDKPAIIVELKKDGRAQDALDQILEKDYPEKFKDYQHNMLLVGIAYDSKTKKHRCIIKKINAPLQSRHGSADCRI